MKTCIVLNFGSRRKHVPDRMSSLKGGCKNGGWDDVSLNEVSMNIAFEISFPLDFKTLGTNDPCTMCPDPGRGRGDVLLGYTAKTQYRKFEREKILRKGMCL
jgi:hypothetical protein